MVLFKISRNLIQIYTKNAPNCTILKKFSGGGMPPNPPSKVKPCAACC